MLPRGLRGALTAEALEWGLLTTFFLASKLRWLWRCPLSLLLGLSQEISDMALRVLQPFVFNGFFHLLC